MFCLPAGLMYFLPIITPLASSPWPLVLGRAFDFFKRKTGGYSSETQDRKSKEWNKTLD